MDSIEDKINEITIASLAAWLSRMREMLEKNVDDEQKLLNFCIRYMAELRLAEISLRNISPSKQLSVLVSDIIRMTYEIEAKKNIIFGDK